jgi:signal transduction histidine kinase
MTWPYYYTPYIWPMLASAAFMGALAVYAWRHRDTPGSISFIFLLATIGLWAVSAAFGVSGTGDATQLFWFKFQRLLTLPAAVAALCFVLEYSGLGRWVSRRNVALLIAPWAVAFPLLFVDDSRLLWSRLWVEGRVWGEQTPLSGAIFLYGMVLLLLTTAVIVVLFVRSPLHRAPAALVLLGQLGPRVAYPLEALNLIPALPLDLTVLGFDFTCLMYAIALFRFHLFDVVPVAREVVLERMEDGMLVLDAQNRVADLNPAAQGLLAAPRSRVIGRDAALVLEAFPGLAQIARAHCAAEAEIPIGASPEQRWYRVSCSSLADRRGFGLGRLIILHDITSLRDAQERLLQQQRALGTLQERERVARDLHDGIGQVMSYVSLQVEAARKLLEDGKAAVADAQLARLAAVARDAHADVREYILDLRTAPSDQRPFFATLSRYLEGFTQNYHIQTSLTVSPGLDEGAFGPETQAQLFRIIQEALSNARRHGDARRVQVTFEPGDRLARVVIQDDGRGFEPAALSRREGGQFGLQFMRERAEGLGGRLEVRAAPGEGTRVVVEAPLSGPRAEAVKPPLLT